MKIEELYGLDVVVPSYRLVWYNVSTVALRCFLVVVPSYRLVWYNRQACAWYKLIVVVPSYRLVWYNKHDAENETR